MSPDRIIMTRAEAIRRRKEEEQKQRDKLAQKKVSIPIIKPAAKPEPKPAPLPKPAAKVSMGVPNAKISMGMPAPKAKPIPVTTSRSGRKFEIATTAPEPKTPAFNAPKTPSITLHMPRIGFGPRVLSFFMAAFCILDMYCMLNYDPFIAHTAEITGNSQVSEQEIQNVLGIDNIPAPMLNPSQVQINILAAFPSIAGAQVDINFPGDVVVTIMERTPIAAWQQDGKTIWLDAAGYGYPPHGQVDNLPSITALGAPPALNVDPTQTIGAHPFLSPDTSQLVMMLLLNMPKGAQLIFDPQYGMGWNDPQGWKAFFGKSIQDASVKMQVYQALLTYLQKKDIKPTLINVEYPNAPYYQMAQ